LQNFIDFTINSLRYLKYVYLKLYTRFPEKQIEMRKRNPHKSGEKKGTATGTTGVA